MRRSLTYPLLAAGVLLATACGRDTDTLEPEPLSTDGTVFTDAFGRGVSFQGFAGSNTNALRIDSTTKRTGIASLRITVPNVGDPAGGYAGGAFVAEVPRDLTGFDALTFWVKGSRAATLDVAGLGNDNTGTSRFTAERRDIPVTTDWTKVIIPIPLASKLTAEKGMLFLAEGPEAGVGMDLWLDDVRFERVGNITNARPAIASDSVVDEVGGTRTLTGTTVTFSVGGTDKVVSAAPGYFTFTSSNTQVAIVGNAGTVTAVGPGVADITATLGTTAATGKLVIQTLAGPTAAAPTPTAAAGDVISLFSNAYTNRTVDTWSASWDQADVTDVTVAGNATKKYTNFVFAGIEFTSAPVNASTMTHLHLDVFLFNDDVFRVKLVDFGANGAFGGGDDTEHEVALSAGSTPRITAGEWSSLDIPLSSFTGLTGRTNIAQLIISGSSSTVYVDNVYFVRQAIVPPTAPVTGAPVPTYLPANVISLFSNTYTNRTIDTWSAPWDQADVADVQVATNDTKRYSNLVFAGIEFTSSQIDATAMTHFRMDIWTPDNTAAPAVFKVKLVDFGADGAFSPGGDDREHELTFNATSTPALGTGSWITLDIPLSQFTGLTTRGHLAQLIIAGDVRNMYVDNVLFHR